jgi:hypothetical protein
MECAATSHAGMWGKEVVVLLFVTFTPSMFLVMKYAKMWHS